MCKSWRNVCFFHLSFYQIQGYLMYLGPRTFIFSIPAPYKCAFFILLLLGNTEAHSVLADWLGSTHDVPSSCYSVFFCFKKRIFWRWHLWYIIVCPSPSIKLAFYHLTFLLLFSYRAPWHIHCTHVISISYPPRIRHLQRHVFDLPSSFSYI